MSHRKIAKKIFEDAIQASLPKNFIPKYCRLEGTLLHVDSQQYDLSQYNNIYVLGSGKAAYTMASELENILDSYIYKGLVIAPNADKQLKKIEVLEGSHPVPTQKSIDAAKALLRMMQECREDDLYIYLLSGGSSALMEIPQEPITLPELQEVTKLMLDPNNSIRFK